MSLTFPKQFRLFMAARAAAAECDSLNSTNAYGSFPGLKKNIQNKLNL